MQLPSSPGLLIWRRPNGMRRSPWGCAWNKSERNQAGFPLAGQRKCFPMGFCWAHETCRTRKAVDEATMGAGNSGRATSQKIILIKVSYYFFCRALLWGHSPTTAEQRKPSLLPAFFPGLKVIGNWEVITWPNPQLENTLIYFACIWVLLGLFQLRFSWEGFLPATTYILLLRANWDYLPSWLRNNDFA